MCDRVLQKLLSQFAAISLAVIVASCGSDPVDPAGNPASLDKSDTVESETGERPSVSSGSETTDSSIVEDNVSVPSIGPETSGLDSSNVDGRQTVPAVGGTDSEDDLGLPSASTIPTVTSPPNSTVPSDVFTEEPTDSYITYEPQT